MNKQDLKGVFKLNLSLSRLILTFMMLLIVVVGGTFAWFTFSSRQSALVLTIGDINNTQIILSPYQVREDDIVPVSGYQNGVYSDVTVKNSDRANTVTLYYKINSLDSTLINKGLKYTIVNTSTNQVVKTGDFKSYSGDEAVIYESNLVSASDVNYRVYLWVDSSVGNQNEIAGKTLDVELNGAIGSATIRNLGSGTTYGEILITDVTDFANHKVDNTHIDTDYTYQWYYNSTASTSGGTPIAGATNRAYRIGNGYIDSDGDGKRDAGESQALANVIYGKYLYVVTKITKGGTTITYTDVTKSTVGKRATTITVIDKSKIYDGAALTSKDVTATNLVSRSGSGIDAGEASDTIDCPNGSCTTSGSITNVGSVDNNLTKYTISKVVTLSGGGTETVVVDTKPSGTPDLYNETIKNGKLIIDKASCVCTISVSDTPPPDDANPRELILPSYNTTATATLSCVDTNSSSRYPDGNRYINSSDPTIVSVGTLTHLPSNYGGVNSKITSSSATYEALSVGKAILSGGATEGSNYKACSITDTKEIEVRKNKFKIEYYAEKITSGAPSGTYERLNTSGHVYGTTSKLLSAASLGIPKSPLPSYGWEFYGWTHNNDSSSLSAVPSWNSSQYSNCGIGHASLDCLNKTLDDQADVTTLSQVDGAIIKLYAVYRRQIVAYSGLQGHITTNLSYQYWNRRNISNVSWNLTNHETTLSKSGGSAANSNMTVTWEQGFRRDNTASAIQYSKNYTGAYTWNYPYKVYSIYSRELQIKHGVNNASTATIKQYYNSADTVSVVSGNATNINYGWSLFGFWDATVTKVDVPSGTSYENNKSIYKDTTTSGDFAFSFAPYITSGHFDAVYNRIIIGYSGINKATTHTGAQYYYTSGKINALSLPTESTTGSFDKAGTNLKNSYDWSLYGWFTDDSSIKADEIITGSYTPAVNSSLTTIYAKYSRTIRVRSGISGVNSFIEHAATQYYNSGSVATNVTSLTLPTTSSAQSFDKAVTAPTASKGWGHDGWRTDTSASSAVVSTYTPSAITNTTIDSSAYHLYALYSRIITAYSGVNKATVHKGMQYYNSYNKVSTLKLPTVDSPGDFTVTNYSYNLSTTNLSTKSWAPIGWTVFSDDASSHVVSVNGATITPGSGQESTDTLSYAMYSRGITAYSGASKTTHTATQYYNTTGVISEITLPTTGTDASAKGSFNAAVVSVNAAWTFSYWITDISSLTDSNLDTKLEGSYTTYKGGSKPTLSVNSSVPTYYAVYNRVVELYRGLNATLWTSDTQYYVTNTTALISNIFIPAANSISGFTDTLNGSYKWSLLGFSKDTTATSSSSQCSFNSTCSVAVDELSPSSSTNRNKMWSVYQRNVEFYSNKASETDPSTSYSYTDGYSIQYYNSCSTLSTVSSYTPQTMNSAWTILGYTNVTKIDDVPTTVASPSATTTCGDGKSAGGKLCMHKSGSTAVSILPKVDSSNIYYALYDRQQDVIFNSGYDDPSTTTDERTAVTVKGEKLCVGDGCDNYPTQFTITVPGATSISSNWTCDKYPQSGTVIDNCNWVFKGWKTNVEALEVENLSDIYLAGEVVSLDLNFGTNYEFYALYERKLTAFSGNAANWTTHTASQYFNSGKKGSGQGDLTNPTMPTLTVASATWNGGKVTAISSTGEWSLLGWDKMWADTAFDTASNTVHRTAYPHIYSPQVKEKPENIYAVYSREVKAYSVPSGRTATQYYVTSKGESTLTLPTSAKANSFHLDISSSTDIIYGYNAGWVLSGWRLDYAADSNDNSNFTCTKESSGEYVCKYKPLWSTNVSNSRANAIFEREIKVYSGYDDPSTTTDESVEHVGYQYFNAGQSSLLTSILTLPNESNAGSFDKKVSSITGWTYDKWISKNTSAAGLSSASGLTSYQPSYSEAADELMVRWKRDITVYSGVFNQSSSNSSLDDQYAGASGVISSITLPSLSSTSSESQVGWSAGGYRMDKQARGCDYNYGTTVTPKFTDMIHSDGTPNNTLWAVYSRTVNFYSGHYTGSNLSSLKHGVGRIQYFNSFGTLGTVTAYTPNDLGESGTWTAKNWVTASLVKYPISGEIELPVTSASTLYAYYEREIKVYSGYDDPNTTTKEWTEHKATQTYISKNTYVSSLVLPSKDGTNSDFIPAKITALAGWEPLHFRNDASEIDPGNTYMPSIDTGNPELVLDLVYRRTITFYSRNLNGTQITDGTSTQECAANGTISKVASHFPSTNIYESGAFAINGYRYDTTPADKQCDADDECVIGVSDLVFSDSTKNNKVYAVYVRNIKAYSGVNKATSHTGKQYYNSSGGFTNVSKIELPTTSNGRGLTNAVSLTSLPGWSYVGWRGNEELKGYDANLITCDANYACTYQPGATTVASKLYAVYTREIKAYSGVNKANEHVATQYYNSYNSASTVSFPTLPNASNSGSFNGGAVSKTNMYSDWEYQGWRMDKVLDVPDPAGSILVCTNKVCMYSPNASLDISNVELYAVYNRPVYAVSYYYDTNNAIGDLDVGTLHTAQQYYNSGNAGTNVTEITMPTTSNRGSFGHSAYADHGPLYNDYKFKFTGWKDDTDASAPNVAAGSKVKPTVNEYKYYYAIYSRVVKMYSGISKGTTHSATEYYNYRNGTSLIYMATASSKGGFDYAVADLSSYGWSHAGWHYSPTELQTYWDNGVMDDVYPAGGLSSPVELCAIYSREILANSGINNATSHEAIQYYNSCGDRTVTTNLNLPTIDYYNDFTNKVSNTISSYGWSHLGWREDSTPTAVHYSNPSSYKPAVDVKPSDLCAVYSRIPTGYSGINGNTSYGYRTHTAYYQYYNSCGDGTNVSSLKLPTTGDAMEFSNAVMTGSNSPYYFQWSFLGWTSNLAPNGDSLLSSEFNASVTSSKYFYAVYRRTVSAMSGTGSSTPIHTAYQYYVTSSVPPSSVTFPTTSSYGSFTEVNKIYAVDLGGWTLLGFSVDGTTNALTSYTYPVDVQPTVAYAIYSGNVTATFYSGINKANNKSVSSSTAYITSSSSSPVTTLTITVPAANQFTDLSYSWSELGFRTDETATVEAYDFGKTYTLDINQTYNFYMVYSRTITAYSGVNKATTHTGTQYYNSSKAATVVSSLKLPTSGAGNDFSNKVDSGSSSLYYYSWAHLGWKDDDGLGSTEMSSYGPSATTNPVAIYAVYLRPITAYSGVNKATTHIGTQYYNSGKAATVVTNMIFPTTSDKKGFDSKASLTGFVSGWYLAGFKVGTTGSTVSSYQPSATTNVSTSIYAVYGIENKVTFNYGTSSSTDVALTGYYSSETTTVPTTGSVTSASKNTVNTLTSYSWDAQYYASSSDSTDSAWVLGSSTRFTLGSDYSYYTVYSRTLTAYSGANKNKTHTWLQYYTSTGSVTVWSLGAGDKTGLASDWSHDGWRDDTTSGSTEFSTYAPGVTEVPSTTICAVYSRSIVAYSGVNKATTNTGEQYYNSCGSASEMTFPTTSDENSFYSSATPITGCSLKGFKVGTSGSTVSSYTPSIATQPSYSYAVYGCDYTAIFYHGVNKAYNTPRSGEVYYSSNSRLVPTTVAITAPSASNNTNITNWTELGYRSDTSASSATISFGESISVSLGTSYYYAVYSRDYNATFYSGISIQNAKKRYGTVYYNTNTSSVPTTTTVTVPSASDVVDLSGWDKEGYIDSTSPESANISFGDSDFEVPLSEHTPYWAVYSRDITFISGLEGDEDGTRKQYYNSGGTKDNVSGVSGFTPQDAGWIQSGYRWDTLATGGAAISGGKYFVPFDNDPIMYYVYYALVTLYYCSNEVDEECDPTSTYSNVYYNSAGYTSAGPDPSDLGEPEAFNFLGWKSDTAANNRNYYSFAPVLGPGKPTTWYALYERNFTLYSPIPTSTGMNSTSTSTQYFNVAGNYSVSISSSQASAPSGWTFNGWTEDGGVVADLSTSATSYTGSQSFLYATYYRYATTHWGSGANSTYMTDSTLQRGGRNACYTDTPEEPGGFDSNWSHKGWRSTQTTGAALAINYSCSTNFYAIYSRTFTVKYMANGGTGAPSNTQKTISAVATSSSSGKYSSTYITLTTSTPSRTNYSFGGWSILPNGNGITFNSGANMTIPNFFASSEYITLYAKWSKLSQKE